MLRRKFRRECSHLCYWFFIITTLTIYSGNLVAFSTIKKLQLLVSNLKELADNKEYSVTVPCGSSALNLFKVWIVLISNCNNL